MIPSRSAPDTVVPWSALDILSSYITSGQLAEIVYRDTSGQICTVHDTIKDLYSRAGHDYVLLGRGVMVGIDHIITLDGQRLCRAAY